MDTEKNNQIETKESEDKSLNNNTPNYDLIGKGFKSISFYIGLYFFVNFILELVPKFYPKGFWNENINAFNITEEQVNSISNNYTWLNLISSVFFLIMAVTIITNLSQIGNEFLKINYHKNSTNGTLNEKQDRGVIFAFIVSLILILLAIGKFYSIF